LQGYFEVYLKAPKAVLQERDYKRIYEKGKGESNPVVGQKIDPELPCNADLVLYQDGRQPRELLQMLQKFLVLPTKF
jgi:adenylylsulfate kinase-like enzyme